MDMTSKVYYPKSDYYWTVENEKEYQTQWHDPEGEYQTLSNGLVYGMHEICDRQEEEALACPDVIHAQERYDSIVGDHRAQLKALRNKRFHTCLHWLKRGQSEKKLLAAEKVFWQKLSDSRKACAAKKDWSDVYLTKEQANEIKEMFRKFLTSYDL
jgi:hypothetical protein